MSLCALTNTIVSHTLLHPSLVATNENTVEEEFDEDDLD